MNRALGHAKTRRLDAARLLHHHGGAGNAVRQVPDRGV